MFLASTSNLYRPQPENTHNPSPHSEVYYRKYSPTDLVKIELVLHEGWNRPSNVPVTVKQVEDEDHENDGNPTRKERGLLRKVSSLLRGTVGN